MKKNFYVIIIFFLIITDIYSQSLNITHKKINDKYQALNLTIEATYPQVDFGPDALMGVRGIATDINNSIDTMVNNIIKKFQKDVSQMPDKTVNGNGSSLSITSSANVINGTFLTADLTEFSFIAGAAHPLTTIHSFNFGTTSPGPLNISDLFLKNSDYLNYLSNYSIKHLKDYAQKEGYSIDDMIMQGASPDVKNFNTWNIKNDSLVITFNPYQVAPYVFGSQTVAIPLSSLINMLDPSGPLSFMFR